jgi:hypothetical protein
MIYFLSFLFIYVLTYYLQLRGLYEARKARRGEVNIKRMSTRRKESELIPMVRNDLCVVRALPYPHMRGCVGERPCACVRADIASVRSLNRVFVL